MPLVPTTTKGTPGATGPAGPQGPQGPAGAPQTPSSATPQSIGTATAGTSSDYARGDHVHAGALVDLSDVSAVGAVAGDLLSYDGAAWTASTAPEVIWTRTGSQVSPANVGDYVTIAGGGGEEATVAPAQLALYNTAGDCIINAAPDLDLQLAAGLKVNGAPGTAGDVLTSNGPGVAPTWQAGGGGGPAPSSATPQSIGTAAPGTSTDYARGDHVHAGALADLSDVAAGGASAGDVLGYTGTTWTPVTPAGPGPWQESGGVVSLNTPQTVEIQAASSASPAILTSPGKWLAYNALGEQVLEVEPELYSMNLKTGASLDPSPGFVSVLEAGQISISETTDSTHATYTATANLWPNVLRFADMDGAHTPTIDTVDALGNPTALELSINELRINTQAGTAGDVLTSNGPGAAPTWTTISGGSGLPTSQTWTVDFRPTSTGGATLAASGWTLVGLTSSGLFADANGNVYELLTQTGTTSVGYFYPTGQTVTASIPWEMELDVYSSILEGFCSIQANEGVGAGNYRWRLLYNAGTGSAGSWQHQGTGGASNLSTPFDVQANSRIVMGIQSEPRASRAFYANGQCVGLVNPSGNAAGSSGTADYPGLFVFGNTSSPATSTAITMRVYGARVLVNGRGTAPPYSRNPWPPVQP